MQVLAPKPAAAKTARVILNCKAGGGHSDADVEKIRQAFDETGFDAEITPLERGKDLREVAREALKS